MDFDSTKHHFDDQVSVPDRIVRIEGTHRYQVTDHGLDTAKLLTCDNDRVLRIGLAEPSTPATTPGRLRSAATAYRNAVDTLTATAQLAA